MIQWTEEKKLWPYPIDNEYDWKDEQGVGFDEHVFLEPMLDKLDFPKSGPIRHFMELVCTGLSKNPYMTIGKKRGHIEWFREYLDDHIDSIQRLHSEEKIHLKKLAEQQQPAT